MERDYMDHNSMNAMAQSFKQAAQTINSTKSEMENIAKAMEGGALLGMGGDAFTAALRGKLKKALDTLERKMGELEKDIKSAQQANREAEGTAKGRFQN